MLQGNPRAPGRGQGDRTAGGQSKGMMHPNGVNGRGFDGLVETLYDAAVPAAEDCAWADVLAPLCEAFSASAGGVLVHDPVTRRGTMQHAFNVAPRFRTAYHELSAENPWIHAVAFCPEGTALVGDEILAPEDVVRSQFYSGWLKPQNLMHSLSGVIMRDGHDSHLLQMLRPPEAAGFGAEEQAQLACILPHLRRSIRLRLRLARARRARDSLSEMMDLLPLAFLLVGRNGHVEQQNSAARQMIAKGDGLFVGAGGYLATASPKSTSELREALTEAEVRTPGGSDATAGRHLIIPRRLGRLPLIAVVFSVGSRDANGEESPAVALLVKDPQSEPLDNLADFARAYRLTRAETRLFDQLRAGGGLLEAAASLGITKNTARTHMRNIYGKVGIHRQADLIRLSARFSLF